jgi:hypothetical protein
MSATINAAHLERQRAFSLRTFGPGARTAGVLDHIRKELVEIEQDPADVGEWVDVIILAFDGAWRAGWEPQQIIDAIKAKQERNEAREWPDWRTAPADRAIEHVRQPEGPAVGTVVPSGRPGFDSLWDGHRWVPICQVCGDEAAYCDGTQHVKAGAR